MSKRKQQRYDYLVKLIIIGDSGVGKTNILMKFCQSNFKDNYVATIGVDFKIKIIQIQQKRIKLQIWDTAGQQRFKNITQTYYKGAAGIVLTYSITDQSTFWNIQKWITQINQNTGIDVKKILIGNKIDLNSDRKISIEQGKRLAQKYNMPFLEVSAKQGTNIDQIFQTLGKSMKTKFESEGQTLQNYTTTKIQNRQKQVKTNSCVC